MSDSRRLLAPVRLRVPGSLVEGIDEGRIALKLDADALPADRPFLASREDDGKLDGTLESAAGWDNVVVKLGADAKIAIVDGHWERRREGHYRCAAKCKRR